MAYKNSYFLQNGYFEKYYYRLNLSVTRVDETRERTMATIAQQLEIEGVPPYVESWSAASLPGFILAVLNRWQHNSGELPSRFVMVVCPQVEINARGGLPERVRELTNPRLRFLHFTGCSKPYVVLLYCGEDAEAWRAEVQQLLAWSEGYHAELTQEVTRLKFIEAIEECDDDYL